MTKQTKDWKQPKQQQDNRFTKNNKKDGETMSYSNQQPFRKALTETEGWKQPLRKAGEKSFLTKKIKKKWVDGK